MPTTSTGLYEVTLEMNAGGQPLKSVFHYLATLGQDDDQDLIAAAFDEDVAPAIANIMNTNIQLDFIRAANLTGDLADAVIPSTVSAGQVVGSNMAAFTAAPFRLVRTTKETRNGSKRIPGMIEENVNGAIFTGPFFTAMESVAATMSAQIATTGIIADIVILRRPDVAGVFTYNEVSTVVALNRLTTQNSRKSF